MKFRLRAFTLAASLLAGFLPGHAFAARYALLISASRGESGETPLRYATRDAEQLGEVLVSLGQFEAENVTLLKDATADGVRRTLARLNARIRQEGGNAKADVLLVYYSGHADAETLHLGGTQLPWTELRDSTSGSAAAARLLILDACRSGQATRVKGLQLTHAFPVDVPAPSESEGFAILSSAAAGEQAQESDAIQGSFFTHHLLVGLRGLADTSNDGHVSLAEAYRYASERTVASTLSTLAGVQHPTYSFEIRGRSDLILTRPSRSGLLAAVPLSRRGVYYFRTGGQEGPVAAEASVGDAPRTLLLPGGRYFVQRRSSTHLDEGFIDAPTGQTVDLARVSWRRVELDQLVRKGGDVGPSVSVSVWGGVGTSYLEGFNGPRRVLLDGGLDLSEFTLALQFGGGRATGGNDIFQSEMYQVGGNVGVRRVFDWGRFSFAPGFRVGLSHISQRFQSDRLAPERSQFSPYVDAYGRLEFRLQGGLFFGLDAALRGQHLRVASRGIDLTESDVSRPLSGTLALGLGWRW